MVRGRGKGKNKLTLTDHDDPGSDEEEKIPVQKRRGRPQKSLKDDIDEEVVEIIEEEDEANQKTGIPNLEIRSSTAILENGKKRKRNTRLKKKHDSTVEENGNGTRSKTDESTRSNGFRHNNNRNRRKNKPHRAAEAGVECI